MLLIKPNAVGGVLIPTLPGDDYHLKLMFHL